jgi:hypothetical protein
LVGVRTLTSLPDRAQRGQQPVLVLGPLLHEPDVVVIVEPIAEIQLRRACAVSGICSTAWQSMRASPSVLTGCGGRLQLAPSTRPGWHLRSLSAKGEVRVDYLLILTYSGRYWTECNRTWGRSRG